MKIDAVFEGGGVKGIGLVGAVCCLENNGYKFENLAGTSAGSMVAALVAAGYNGAELKDIILKTKYINFLGETFLDKIKVLSLASKGINLIKNKGIYSGDAIEDYMEELLKAKRKTRFKDVSRNGKCYLKIIASDITRGRMLILPDDLKDYGIDPMNFKISKAVRMSTAIPLFFQPVKLNYKNKISLIVDGGILSNYPIWIFDVAGTPRWPTFGLKLTENKPTFTSKGKTDIISFSIDVVRAMVSRNEEMYVKNKDWVRTIGIPTLGIGGTDFNITEEQSLKLFESGYKSTEKFLMKWDFEDYKKKRKLRNFQ